MALGSLNTSAPPVHPRSEDVMPDSWREAKRSKSSESDDEYLARCLVALARSGGHAPPSAANTTPSAATAAFETQQNSTSPTVPPPDQINPYKCSFCEKSFKSHQALGGHKASHRSRPPIILGNDGKPSKATRSATTEAPSFAGGPHPTGRLHKCATCGSSFSTGQALGGHMRKHYVDTNSIPKGGVNSSDGGNGNGNGSSVVTSSSDRGAVSFCTDNTGGDTTTLSPWNFDLNFPSSPELDLTLKL